VPVVSAGHLHPGEPVVVWGPVLERERGPALQVGPGELPPPELAGVLGGNRPRGWAVVRCRGGGWASRTLSPPRKQGMGHELEGLSFESIGRRILPG
jgi:hypothetical protein